MRTVPVMGNSGITSAGNGGSSHTASSGADANNIGSKERVTLTGIFLFVNINNIPKKSRIGTYPHLTLVVRFHNNYCSFIPAHTN